MKLLSRDRLHPLALVLWQSSWPLMAGRTQVMNTTAEMTAGWLPKGIQRAGFRQTPNVFLVALNTYLIKSTAKD